MRRGVRQGEQQGTCHAEQLHEDQQLPTARHYSATELPPTPSNPGHYKVGLLFTAAESKLSWNNRPYYNGIDNGSHVSLRYVGS